jgi:hypothetical protein
MRDKAKVTATFRIIEQNIGLGHQAPRSAEIQWETLLENLLFSYISQLHSAAMM